MQIAVRSYLTAGAVAVVGAGSIALAPPVPSVNLAALPAPVVADVTLTGVSLSLEQIVAVLGKFGLGDVISPIVNLLPANLVNNFVAEFSDEALGLVKTAVKGIVTDLSSVIGGLIVGPTSIIHTVFNSVAGVPMALIAAVKSLSSGDLSNTLQTLVAPLTGLGTLITDAVKTFATHVTDRISELVKSVPDLLVNVVQAVVTNDFNSVVDMVKKAIDGISKVFGGASVRAVAPAAAALGAAPVLAVAALPVAEVPSSVAVSPHAVSRADRAVARAHAVTATPKPAAAEAAPAEAATPAEVPAFARAERVAPAAESLPAASPRSKAAAHSRAAASRAAKASGAE